MSAILEEATLTDHDYKDAAGRLFKAKKVEGYMPVALHLYRTADGSILYGRVRMHKQTADGGHEKLIRPFWHDGTRWTHGEPPQPGGKVLYGLHYVSALPMASVVLTEGEQKVDALTTIGAGQFIGVTSGACTSAGAADWSPLAGRHVLLWPDHDAPGAKYADEVTAKLLALGCTVERLDVAAMSLPEKSDVVDWLEQFKVSHDRMPTADEVLALPKVGAPAGAAAESVIRSDSSQTEPPRETDDQSIERLATLKPMEYDRVRKAEAKRMGVQVSTLDKLVSAARSEEGGDTDGPFTEVEPWHEPVDGAALLDDLVRVVHRFIVCNAATAHGSALWITMTWLMDSVDVAPIAAITAPEKRCGKSQLLFLMGRLSNRALTASNITPAALFRAIEAWRPTLLIDEADAFMRENEELRGLLNCGHTRDSAFVVRTVGDDHMPKQFFVWGAKAIAGIGHLADTLMDRSITLELRRKMPHEQVDKLRHAESGMFERLRSKLARWSDDNANAVRAARPELPDTLHDRAADNWEPLLQIAEVAGSTWPEMARRAALKLSGESEQSQSTGTELLADIKTAFEKLNVSRISMADLLTELLTDDEAPWKTWNRGREMTTRQLGKKLSEYGIKSKAVKIGYESPKGFMADHFKDAFDRYLSAPPVTGVSSVTQSPPNAGAGFEVTEAQSRDQGKTPSVTAKPLSHKAGDRVTDETAESQGEGKFVTDDTEEDV
ncbi:DUF3631 domain-containing protein [Paraburkholderia dipogonis]|uniref:DUF3631 domain-containing protein n=1 Tax=Paraburkholderia dipogonis TaxID=1211383 RepID=UPI0038B9440E